MAFTHTKKVDTESFIKARIRIRSQTSGSGSDQKVPDPTGSGTLVTTGSILMIETALKFQLTMLTYANTMQVILYGTCEYMQDLYNGLVPGRANPLEMV
jgi:hypothetical protein